MKESRKSLCDSVKPPAVSCFSLLCAGMIAAALFLYVSPAAAEEVNLAPKCRVIVSSTANPAWDARNLVDDDIGPTKGWLGEWKADAQPWAKFVLPSPAKIMAIRVLPASFTEVGYRRFARPKKVTLVLKGDKDRTFEADLKDDENRFQEIKLDNKKYYEISIIITETYSNATYPGQTGFQEVQIITDFEEEDTAAPPEENYLPKDSSNPVQEARRILDAKEDASRDSNDEDKPGAKPSPKKGKLTSDEKEILDLIRELLERLEKKFNED